MRNEYNSEIRKHYLEEYFSEFIGSFFLVFFGCGAIILSKKSPTALPYEYIPIIFGLSISVMVTVLGKISGAHFNPAITLGFWAVKKFPSFKIPAYIFSQLSGACSAGLIHYFIWGSHEHLFGASIFHGQASEAFIIETIGSFFLMFVYCAVSQESKAQDHRASIALGISLTLTTFLFLSLTGASLNPTRSIAPAIWSSYYEGIWIYIFAPVIGAVVAALSYERLSRYKKY